MIINMRPSCVAVAVASKGLSGQEGRIFRMQFLFPDIGKEFILYRVGFLRYAGEVSVVVPDSTEVVL